MKIKIADVRIKLDKIGQDVIRKGVTTAEAAILIAEHNAKAGGVPLEVLPETESEKDVNPIALYSYLTSRYGAKKVKNIYPSASVRYPETFKEAEELGMVTNNPTGKLFEADLATM